MSTTTPQRGQWCHSLPRMPWLPLLTQELHASNHHPSAIFAATVPPPQSSCHCNTHIHRILCHSGFVSARIPHLPSMWMCLMQGIWVQGGWGRKHLSFPARIRGGCLCIPWRLCVGNEKLGSQLSFSVYPFGSPITYTLIPILILPT